MNTELRTRLTEAGRRGNPWLATGPEDDPEAQWRCLRTTEKAVGPMPWLRGEAVIDREADGTWSMQAWMVPKHGNQIAVVAERYGMSSPDGLKRSAGSAIGRVARGDERQVRWVKPHSTGATEQDVSALLLAWTRLRGDLRSPEEANAAFAALSPDPEVIAALADEAAEEARWEAARYLRRLVDDLTTVTTGPIG